MGDFRSRIRDNGSRIQDPGSQISDVQGGSNFSFVQHEPESLMLISIKLEYVYKWHITVLNSVNMYFHKYFAISYL